MTTKCEVTFPLPLPDDPHKWDGWAKYKSPNLYERLCLDPKANPTNEAIEEHCRELMRWWQKKLPLKNQPSNPMAQLLQPGLEESSRYLTEARVELLDPERRKAMDNELATQLQEEAGAELRKYISFSIAYGVLSPEAEKSLFQFGAEHGLSQEQIAEIIEAELKDSGAKRAVPAPPSAPAPAQRAGSARPRRRESLDPKEDFMRMLRLSGLDGNSMTDDQRDAFVNMAENLGIDVEGAEDLVDQYLDEVDNVSAADVENTPGPRVEVAQSAAPNTEARSTEKIQPEEAVAT